MDKKGVTAIHGIILLVIIVFIIAVIVFLYINSQVTTQTTNYVVEGTVLSMKQTGSVTYDNEPSTIWIIGFNDGKEYKMLLRDSNNLTIPQIGVKYRFYHNIVEVDNVIYFDVHHIVEI